MGTKAPSIRGIDVNSLELDEDQKLIESVDVGIDLEYSGGFAIGIDVALAYGKTAFMSAKGKSLSVSSIRRMDVFTIYTRSVFSVSIGREFAFKVCPAALFPLDCGFLSATYT